MRKINCTRKEKKRKERKGKWMNERKGKWMKGKESEWKEKKMRWDNSDIYLCSVNESDNIRKEISEGEWGREGVWRKVTGEERKWITKRNWKK